MTGSVCVIRGNALDAHPVKLLGPGEMAKAAQVDKAPEILSGQTSLFDVEESA